LLLLVPLLLLLLLLLLVLLVLLVLLFLLLLLLLLVVLLLVVLLALADDVGSWVAAWAAAGWLPNAPLGERTDNKSCWNLLLLEASTRSKQPQRHTCNRDNSKGSKATQEIKRSEVTAAPA
jgi:hypothetical protein